MFGGGVSSPGNPNNLSSFTARADIIIRFKGLGSRVFLYNPVQRSDLPFTFPLDSPLLVFFSFRSEASGASPLCSAPWLHSVLDVLCVGAACSINLLTPEMSIPTCIALGAFCFGGAL